MNLELLDPFRKQIPDRVDATLIMPTYFHSGTIDPATIAASAEKTAIAAAASSTTTTTTTPGKPHASIEEDDDDWKAAYHVAYNRRGRFLAVGYGSGLVGVYDCISRNLAATYSLEGLMGGLHGDPHITPKKSKQQQQQQQQPLGVTSLSWSRRSRTLLAGAMGDTLVRLYDTTHPHGPEDCTTNLVAAGGGDTAKDKDKDLDDDEDNTGGSTTKASSTKTPLNPRASPSNPLGTGDRPSVRRSSFSNLVYNNSNSGTAIPMDTTSSSSPYVQVPKIQQASSSSSGDFYAKEPRFLTTTTATTGSSSPPPGTTSHNNNTQPPPGSTATRYPGIYFRLPQAIGGSLEVHPRHTTAGLAVLHDGSLVLFWIPPTALWQQDNNSNNNHNNTTNDQPKVRLWTLWKAGNGNGTITCASFDPQGQHIYASTKQGSLLGFQVDKMFANQLLAVQQSSSSKPQFTIRIPGGAAVWHLLVSRNGKYIVLNCADGALRLYNSKDLWEQQQPKDSTSIIKPHQVFSDLINRQVKFASCALSGDGEYIVGGANEVRDDKYELYIWNTSTGALMDKLTGAPVNLYSVAWHPTRSLCSVATSDGLVDVWAPKVNWTAFAPDFQALPMNVEYVEREDEFDLDEHGKKLVPVYQAATARGNDDDDDNHHHGENDDDDQEETAMVDVMTIEPVPVFASDSEDEQDVFYFETKFANTIGNRGRHATVDT